MAAKRITIEDRIRAEMAASGYAYLGKINGTYSTRKGSNLSNYLKRLGKTHEQVIVKIGARAGPRANDGHELLIFDVGKRS